MAKKGDGTITPYYSGKRKKIVILFVFFLFINLVSELPLSFLQLALFLCTDDVQLSFFAVAEHWKDSDRRLWADVGHHAAQLCGHCLLHGGTAGHLCQGYGSPNTGE